MTSLTGTAALVRLALRHDRIRLPIWLGVLLGLLALQGAGVNEAYPDMAAKISYATVMTSSAAARLFGAPDGPSLGAIMMVEIYATACVLAALMSSFGVVRHTRRNEETGRLELVCSTVVGRQAGLAAALIVMLGTNLLLAVGAAAVLMALGMPAAGSVIMGSAIGGIGAVFAGVAAVTSQLASSSRLANGLAGMLLGAAFIVAALGSIAGGLRPDGLGVVLAWPSWLSPLGWGQLAYPFTQQRWWALAPYLVVTAMLVSIAAALSARRDLGQGMLPSRAARSRAQWWLLSPIGLAVRLQRGLWLGWALGTLAMGVTAGAFADEMEELVADNDAVKDLFVTVGGSDVLRDSYMALMMAWIAVLIGGYVVQAVLRLHSEEEEGHLESILSTGTGRAGWLASHVLVTAVGALLLLLVAGLGTGVAAAIATGERDLVAQLVGAALVQAPAVLVLEGITVLAFGTVARWSPIAGWSWVGISVAVLMGDLFRIPERVLDVSPFAHVPLLPVEDLRLAPVFVLLAVAAACTAAGTLQFLRRDVAG